MKVEKFEELIAWKKSKELSFYIYKIFKDCRDLSFRSQIERASVSIMNNIAEGFERYSKKDFIHFLYISKGSAGEVRSMSILGFELDYLKKEDFDYINNQSTEISKILSGLIKSLK